MTGEELKLEIKRRGCTIRQIALALGRSEQNFGRMLKTSESVSSAVIEKTAEIMGVPVSELYAKGGDTITAHDHSTAFKGTNNCDARLLEIIQTRDRQMEKYMTQMDKSQQQIDRLLAIIETMKEDN